MRAEVGDSGEHSVCMCLHSATESFFTESFLAPETEVKWETPKSTNSATKTGGVFVGCLGTAKTITVLQ